MSLLQLAAFAVSTNTRTSIRVFELSLDEARSQCEIKDGNKSPNEDGSRALQIVLGKIIVPLDAIAPKATRVNATAEQVEEFTSLLQAGIDDGSFDEAIKEAQDKAKLSAERTAATKAAKAKAALEQEPAGDVDLDALDQAESTDEAADMAPETIEDELLG